MYWEQGPLCGPPSLQKPCQNWHMSYSTKFISTRVAMSTVCYTIWLWLHRCRLVLGFGRVKYIVITVHCTGRHGMNTSLVIVRSAYWMIRTLIIMGIRKSSNCNEQLENYYLQYYKRPHGGMWEKHREHAAYSAYHQVSLALVCERHLGQSLWVRKRNSGSR